MDEKVCFWLENSAPGGVEARARNVTKYGVAKGRLSSAPFVSMVQAAHLRNGNDTTVDDLTNEAKTCIFNPDGVFGIHRDARARGMFSPLRFFLRSREDWKRHKSTSQSCFLSD